MSKNKILQNIKLIIWKNHQDIVQKLTPDDNSISIDLETKPNLVSFTCKTKLIIPLSRIINMEEL